MYNEEGRYQEKEEVRDAELEDIKGYTTNSSSSIVEELG